MRKLLLPILLVLGLTFSCSKSEVTESSGKILAISGAEISQSSDFATDDEVDTSFSVGDKITVVGAAEDDVVFIYKSDGSWQAEGTYEWMENPQTVKAYYGQDTFIDDGDQMPDLLVATYECGGVIPDVLSFTDVSAFEHATAMLEVIIKDWTGIVEPSVRFQTCHNVIAVGSNGVYHTDANALYTIYFEAYSAGTDKTAGLYAFRARVPAGTEETPYIIASSAALYFGDSSQYINIFTYMDEDDIPVYYEAGKIFTYTITYITE